MASYNMQAPAHAIQRTVVQQRQQLQQYQQQQQQAIEPNWHCQSTRPVSLATSCNPSQSSPNTYGSRTRKACMLPRSLAPGIHVLPFSPSPGPRAPNQSGKALPWEKHIDFPVLAPPSADAQMWVEAARSFTMNMDFDVSAALKQRSCHDLPSLMAVMKEESVGKQTIQALSDKLMLHRLVSNLGVPQMPCLLAVEGQGASCRPQVDALVQRHVYAPGSGEVVVKPTHLSNGDGVIVVARPEADVPDATAQFVTQHIQQHLAQRAGDHESVALRSLRPGFLAQPIYDSSFNFETPLEIRLVTLWGKVRLAVWWWGRSAGEHSQRNSWFMRRPTKDGQLGDTDIWEPLHEHPNSAADPGFEAALELFRAQVPHLTRSAEALATAVGAPFLRADFFVGDARWGARLNEVAYGCGVDYRSLSQDGTGRIVDDAPAIAEILLQGLEVCRQRLPARHFLSRLGASGDCYEDMTVSSLPLGSPKPAAREETQRIVAMLQPQRREVSSGSIVRQTRAGPPSGQDARSPRSETRYVYAHTVPSHSGRAVVAF